LDHVSVVVDDLAAAIAFFTALGMTLEGEMPVEGPWVHRVNRLESRADGASCRLQGSLAIHWRRCQQDDRSHRQNPTVEFPDDGKFELDITTKPLYGRRLAAYVLREYERGIKGGDALPDGVEMSIDHIMPQVPTDSWKKEVTAEDHKALVHTWGNLVPLSPLQFGEGTARLERSAATPNRRHDL
jgi:hypothetical protein